MVTVFALHMMCAIPNAGPYVEFSIEDTPWTDRRLDPPLTVTDGTVPVHDTPGWGVSVNPAWFRGAEVRVSEE